MRPAATFANYVPAIKITQYFWRLGIQLAAGFQRETREPARNKGCGPVQ